MRLSTYELGSFALLGIIFKLLVDLSTSKRLSGEPCFHAPISSRTISLTFLNFALDIRNVALFEIKSGCDVHKHSGS